MDKATQQFKGDVWQVLAHLWANDLLWIALVFVIAGLASTALLPRWRFGRGFFLCGIGLGVFAVFVHGLAWTPIL